MSGPQRLGFPRLRRSLERGDQVWEWAFPARWSRHRVLRKAALTPSSRSGCERQKWLRPESQLSSGPAMAARWLPLQGAQAPPGGMRPLQAGGGAGGNPSPWQGWGQAPLPACGAGEGPPFSRDGRTPTAGRAAAGSRGEWRTHRSPCPLGGPLSRDEGGDCG